MSDIDEKKRKRSIINKRYWEKNKDREKKRSKKWKLENKDKCKKYQKQYYQDNKDKIKKERRDKYNDNTPLAKEQRKEYYKNNGEKERHRNREYYKKNKEKCYAYSKEYFQTEKGKASRANTAHKRRVASKETDITTDWLVELKEKTTNCPYCNAELINTKKELDHINPLSKGGTHTKNNVCYCCQSCNRHKSDSIITAL